MKIDEMFQIFKEIYYFELDHKHKIDSSLNLPTNSIVLILPASFFIYKYYINVNPVLCIIIFSSISIFLLLAIYYLLRCYLGHKYSFLPDYDKLLNKMEEIKIGNKTIYNELIKQYITSAEPNKHANLKRLKLLFKCKLCILGSLVLLAVLTLLYFKEI